MVKGEKCCPMMFVTKRFLAGMVNAIIKVGYSANLEGIECHSQRKAFLSQNEKIEGNCKAQDTRFASQCTSTLLCTHLLMEECDRIRCSAHVQQHAHRVTVLHVDIGHHAS